MAVEQRWQVLSDGARPTEDIYFLESVAPLLRSEGHDVGRLDVRGWRWLERERGRFGRIVYLIDDDLAAAAEDETLPLAYRERMTKAASQQPRLLALADEVVACSSVLAERFVGRHSAVRVITPPLISPLLDTPFNRGKSFIKFLDIAAMGGVGIYSRRYPYTQIVENGVNGLLADDDPADWQRCLTWLLDHPEETRRMAEAAADTARRVGDAQRAAEFWRERS